MPWKECSVMEERMRFVARLLEGEEMCGEPGMIGPGRIVVESREAFMKRLRGHSP